ncbi:MAG: hypothetical protein SF162_07770 [bacterium]|nr:hypothetical protein [bacterium]
MSQNKKARFSLKQFFSGTRKDEIPDTIAADIGESATPPVRVLNPIATADAVPTDESGHAAISKPAKEMLPDTIRKDMQG